jgi:hypothetical protein
MTFTSPIISAITESSETIIEARKLLSQVTDNLGQHDNTSTHQTEITTEKIVSSTVQNYPSHQDKSILLDKLSASELKEGNVSFLDYGDTIETNTSKFSSTSSHVLDEPIIKENTVRETTVNSNIKTSYAVTEKLGVFSETPQFLIPNESDALLLVHSAAATEIIKTSTPESFLTTKVTNTTSHSSENIESHEDIMNGNLLLGGQNSMFSNTRLGHKRLKNSTLIRGLHKNGTERTTIDSGPISDDGGKESITQSHLNTEPTTHVSLVVQTMSNDTSLDTSLETFTTTVKSKHHYNEDIETTYYQTSSIVSNGNEDIEQTTIVDMVNPTIEVTPQRMSEKVIEHTLEKPIFPHENAIEDEDQGICYSINLYYYIKCKLLWLKRLLNRTIIVLILYYN